MIQKIILCECTLCEDFSVQKCDFCENTNILTIFLRI